ncbi:MAG: YceI family protein [Flavobacteriales bacterium]
MTDIQSPLIFFDAAAHPTMHFKSNSVEGRGSDWMVNGTLTIKGGSHPVSLKAEYAGIAVDPYGQTKTGLSITGTIKRSDFGLTWSAVTEAGNIVVGYEIYLSCEVQFVRQA